ncbi:MAG: amidase [Acidimicrobiales bacterium]
MDDLAFRPATELAAAVRSRQVSSRELLALYLDRIERYNEVLNAVVTLDGDRAMEEATAADQVLMGGGPVGPLHGLPVTIKDALEVAGMRATGGAVELMNHVPDTTAPAVARLIDAGAIVFGKTNLPRWSGDGQSYNEMFGVTNNPWDTTRTPGGSSGGAAAAVAAGLTSFEVGTDIGGSIRIPSHFTGVWGHKPSFGTVPGLGYLDGPQGGTAEADNNVLGPLARSAADLELLYGVMSGPSPLDEPGWRLQLPPPRHDDLRNYRVAAWLDDEACPVDGEMLVVLDRTVAALEAAGVSVDRNARPDLDLATASRLGKQLIVAATSVSLATDDIEELAERSKGGAALVLRHHAWLERDRARRALRAVWDEFFTEFDLLLCPVTVGAAFPHATDRDWSARSLVVDGDERPYTDLLTWTALIGMAYLPVTTPPLGTTVSGLPSSVQVVAPYLHDRMAIDGARQIAELAGGGYTPPPAVA